MSDDLPRQLREMVPACDDPCDYTDDDRKILAAADRIEALEAAYNETCDSKLKAITAMTARIEELERRLREWATNEETARREALEEAARLCEEFAAMSRSTTDRDIGRQQRIAHAIRALKEKE